MRACAPGKIILSGEHSVVFGAPAVAVAVNLHTRVHFKPITESNTINTLFSGISSGFQYPLSALGSLKDKLDSRFDAFLKGKLPIQQVLNQPDDLLMYTLSSLAHHLPLPGRASSTSYLPMPGRLQSESDLPLGAGMGSSAASIAATLVLFEHLLEKPLDIDKRFEMVRFCERLQHGKGSAIDAAAVTYGGLNLVQGEQTRRIETSLGPGWYWAYRGKPEVSTGECVQYVRERFGSDTSLWNDFTAVTNELVSEIAAHHKVVELVRENHRLLQNIGVTTQHTSAVVEKVESLGGAAKVSGAGAHRGENGGLILIYLPDEPINSVIKEFPELKWGAIEEDKQGARYLGD